MDVEPYELALATPLATARGTIDTRRGFLVRITTDDGPGIGEAAPLPGFTESLAACREVLEEAETLAAESGLEAATTSIDPQDTPAAAHGLELARLDAAARGTDRSVAGYLSDSPHSQIPVNATIGAGGVDAARQAARAAVDAGFGCLKVKVGAADSATDLARLRAVREVVGPDRTLRADANGAFGVHEAAAIAEELAAPPIDLAYLEQPLPPQELPAMARLRETIPVAVDETLCSHSLGTVLTHDAADVVVLKPMVHGPPMRTRELALEAIDAGLEAVISTTVDAVVARTAAVHLAASLPRVPPAGLATADRLASDLGADPAPVRDGSIAVPTQPGIGLGSEVGS